MKAYYYLISNLKSELESIATVNTVSVGAIDDVDLLKKTIYPLVHIIVNSVRYGSRVNVYNVTIMAADVVDINKDTPENTFESNDNEHDVLNSMDIVLNRLVQSMIRGDLYDREIIINEDDSPEAEPFTERFENYLAGWGISVDIQVPNEMSIC